MIFELYEYVLFLSFDLYSLFVYFTLSPSWSSLVLTAKDFTSYLQKLYTNSSLPSNFSLIVELHGFLFTQIAPFSSLDWGIRQKTAAATDHKVWAELPPIFLRNASLWGHFFSVVVDKFHSESKCSAVNLGSLKITAKWALWSLSQNRRPLSIRMFPCC